jgi:Calcineurin-like phosphoesterase
VRVLHVSDLHASATDAVDRRAIVQAFLADVKVKHGETPIDLVLFSGDLAFGGVSADYTIARDQFVLPLLKAIELEASHLVMAPGNHDVDISKIDDIIEGGLRSRLQTREELCRLFDEGRVPLYTDRIGEYESFHDDFYAGSDVVQVADLAYCHRLTVRGVVVGVAAIDSAWRATGSPNDADQGHLLVGDRQIRYALEALGECDVRIAVLHHPLNWMSPFDHDDIRIDLEKQFDLIATGHLHEPEPQQVAGSRGHCVYSQAGCLYETADYPNAYSLIDIDRDSNAVRFAIREYVPRRREFDAAVRLAEGGIVEVPFRASSSSPGADLVARVPYTSVLRTLADVAQTTSVLADHVSQLQTADLGDIIVPPVVLPIPYEQALIAEDPKSRARVERSDILKELTENRCVVLVGDPETGLTSALLWTLQNHFERDSSSLPVYLSFSSIGPGKSPIDDAISSYLARLEGGPFADHRPPLIIAVDDVVLYKPKILRRLIDYVAAHPEDSFLLGCHQRSHDGLIEAMEARGVSSSRLFLGPFGPRELRSLSRKFLGGLDRALVSRVLKVIRSEKLPRTPFLMAALVVVLDSSDLPVNERTETSILDRYVNILLGRVAPAEDPRFFLDFRNYEHILARLAERLVHLGAERLSRIDAEEFLVEYWRSKGWEGSPSKVLDSLVLRRMLTEDDHGIGFRHPALRDLFLAKMLLEDGDVRRWVLEDPLRYAPAIRHAAALARSDRDLLVAASDVLEQRRLEIDGVNEGLFRLVGDAPGWSSSPDLANAARMLGPVPETPVEQLDDQYDEVWEEMEAAELQRTEPEPTPSRRFMLAVDLLSGVLRNSELVDDVELKYGLLTAAIRGWGTGAVFLALDEDRTNVGRDLFASIARDLGSKLDDDALARLAETMAKVMIALATGIAVLEGLGTVKLLALVERALDDDEFMSEPANALFTTFLYVQMVTKGRGARLRILLDMHGSHVVVREIVRFIALRTYYRESLSHDETTRYENVLVEVGLLHQGVREPRARASAQGRLLAEIRRNKALQSAASDIPPALEISAVGVDEEEADDDEVSED